MYTLLRRTAGAVSRTSRDRRMRRFIEVCAPSPGDRILDLGGGDGSLLTRYLDPSVYAIAVADRDTASLDRARANGVEALFVDSEEGSLPFEDSAFDIVFCNSVIEHVTGPKTGDQPPDRHWTARALRYQSVFASEIQRISRGYFVQTPHPAFPLDQHVWLPFTHWLPPSAARRTVAIADRVWVKHCGVMDWNLLGPVAMRRLFPDSEIEVESWHGLPKSVLAWRRG